MVVVTLQSVVDEMEIVNAELHAYLNKKTGKLITLSDEDIAMTETEIDWEGLPDWQRGILHEAVEVLGSEDFLELPSQFDFHEYAIMKDFCYSIEKAGVRFELIDLIQGPGAFRRFKEAIYRHRIENLWFEFRQRAFEEIAVAWLDQNGIAYTRDDRD